MLYKEVFRVLGKFFLYFSLIFIIPLTVACYFEFIKHSFLPHSSKAFLESMLICLASALFFLFLGKGATNQFHRKESILLVVVIWILAAAFSSLPFCLSKTLNNPIDAYFESMSGLTTTGATVMCPKLYKNGEEVSYIDKNEDLPNKSYIYLGTIKPVQDPKTDTVYTGVEAVSEAVLFWRSFIQWLGGLGMIVLFLTIMPAIAVGGKYLLQAEMTGPIKDTLTPRIKETSTFLLKIYLGFTVLQVVLLLLTNSNMPFLDALSITFATLSTGGFSNNNLSIAGYNNVHTEWITMVFMFIGSVNFALYYHCLKGKFFRVYEPDFFLYVAILVTSIILVCLFLLGTSIITLDGKNLGPYTFTRALRDSSFQVISAETSTGFATADIVRWPMITQLILFVIMYIGGMSGSTAGGIKTSRVYILYKIIVHKIEEIFRPDSVHRLKIGSKEIDHKAQTTVLVFFCIVTFITLAGTILMILDNVDVETALGTVACMLNNVGFGFNEAGPSHSFAFLSATNKILSSFWMLLGRLEYFVVLLLFIPGFWRSK